MTVTFLKPWPCFFQVLVGAAEGAEAADAAKASKSAARPLAVFRNWPLPEAFHLTGFSAAAAPVRTGPDECLGEIPSVDEFLGDTDEFLGEADEVLTDESAVADSRAEDGLELAMASNWATREHLPPTAGLSPSPDALSAAPLGAALSSAAGSLDTLPAEAVF